MSDDELLRKLLDVMGWREPVKLPGEPLDRITPGLHDDGFWLRRLLAECRRRHWLAEAWPDGWTVSLLEWHEGHGWVASAIDVGRHYEEGTGAAALARAMLAADAAEREAT